MNPAFRTHGIQWGECHRAGDPLRHPINWPSTSPLLRHRVLLFANAAVDRRIPHRTIATGFLASCFAKTGWPADLRRPPRERCRPVVNRLRRTTSCSASPAAPGSACLVLAPPLLWPRPAFVRTPGGAAVRRRHGLPDHSPRRPAPRAGTVSSAAMAFSFCWPTVDPTPPSCRWAPSSPCCLWKTPNATWFGIANRLFCILFGYALLRSRDLWLPIGPPSAGTFPCAVRVNVSGLRMKVTGYEMSWTAGHLWSAATMARKQPADFPWCCSCGCLSLEGAHSPQPSPLTTPPRKVTICEASPPPLS